MPAASPALTRQRAMPEAENEKAIASRAPGGGRSRGPQGGGRARQTQSRLRHRSARRSTASSAPHWSAKARWSVQNETADLATIQQLDPIYADFTQSVDRTQSACAARSRAATSIASRPMPMKVRLVLDDGAVYPLAGKSAVFRGQGRCPHRAGDVARRVSQSEARIAAGHVCPRPDRAGHRYRRHRGAAAGDPAQWRRRQRSVRGQGRQPCRGPAGAHRLAAGRPMVRHRRPESRRQGRGRRLSEIRRRRQGQAAGLDRSGCIGRAAAASSRPAQAQR